MLVNLSYVPSIMWPAYLIGTDVDVSGHHVKHGVKGPYKSFDILFALHHGILDPNLASYFILR